MVMKRVVGGSSDSLVLFAFGQCKSFSGVPFCLTVLHI